VPKHEQYEELSTLAMIGEASAAELRDLKEHLDQCPDCRQEYFEFVQFVLPQLSLAADTEPVHELMAEDRKAIRADFLTKAANAGVHFSEEALAGPEVSARPEPISLRKAAAWPRLGLRYGLALGLAVILVVGAFLVGRRSNITRGPVFANLSHAEPTPLPKTTQTSSIVTPDPVTPDPSIADTQLAELRKELADVRNRLEKSKTALDASDAERAALREQIAKRDDLLKETEGAKQGSEDARASLQAQLEKLEQKQSALEADYASQTAAVVELADRLKQQKTAAEQERQLAMTHSEVRDLMASRNLHIVDVFDTDTRGKTKPIFGRVFFAENTQLVFYAYDLNEVQGRDTKIDYHVWGQKEGPGHSAKSLGVFRSDDNAQRRWVFKSDDEQLLSQIDSIFVTVEKKDSPKAEPKGQKLMYAYLRDRPNHP
jgi:hypothetical protein